MISLVTPNFNGERWLDDCLSSVANQTLSQDQIEVLVIDDGSTDNSRAIIEGFSSDIPGLKTTWHEHTGRPGELRNVGLNKAMGEYVLFLDSDDFLGEESLERLNDFTRESPSDVVAFQLEGLDREVPTSMLGRTITDADVVDSGLYKTLGTWKMCNLDFLNQTGIRFSGLGRGEDVLFFAEAMLRAPRVSVVAGYPFYNVRGRRDGSSITQETWSNSKRIELASRMADIISRWSPDARTSNHFLIRAFNTDAVGVLTSSSVTQEDKENLRAALAPYWNDEVKELIYTDERRKILEGFFAGDKV